MQKSQGRFNSKPMASVGWWMGRRFYLINTLKQLAIITVRLEHGLPVTVCLQQNFLQSRRRLSTG